jgi:nitroreductase
MAMDVYEALYTTRAMRRVKPDPIPLAVQEKILDAASRAPNGGNGQQWRFLLVDDPSLLAELKPLFADSWQSNKETVYAEAISRAHAQPTDRVSRVVLAMESSVQYLADHFEALPLVLFAFGRGQQSGGSIFPAVWSAQLAARAEGVGSALTSMLLVHRGADVLRTLRVPEDAGWSPLCCVTFGYPLGRWAVAPRRPVHQVSYRNAWGQPVGFEIDQPMWSQPA